MSTRIWQRIDITKDEWVELNKAAALDNFPLDIEWRVGGYTAILWKYGEPVSKAIEYLISLRLEEAENQNEKREHNG